MKRSDISKKRSPRNRTLTISNEDHARLSPQLVANVPNRALASPITGIINGDCKEWTKMLPPGQVDLLFLDPPYNLDKSFNGKKFARQDVESYTEWLDVTLQSLKRLLKPTASITSARIGLLQCLSIKLHQSTSLFEIGLPGNGKKGEAQSQTGRIRAKTFGFARCLKSIHLMSNL